MKNAPIAAEILAVSDMPIAELPLDVPSMAVKLVEVVIVEVVEVIVVVATKVSMGPGVFSFAVDTVGDEETDSVSVAKVVVGNV